MTPGIAEASLNKTAKMAGLLFLSTLVVPLLNWLLVLSRLIAPGRVDETARNVLANEFLFRVNVLAYVVTSLIVVALASALYVLLEPMSKSLAVVALCLKLMEGAVWAVLAVGHIGALLVLNGRASSVGFEPGQVEALVGGWLDGHMQATAVAGVLSGLGFVVFLHLLYRSRYVPRALSGFGVLSYALLFAYDSILILSPEHSKITAIQVVGWGPSVLVEIAMGSWLLVRGIADRRSDGAAPSSTTQRGSNVA